MRLFLPASLLPLLLACAGQDGSVEGYLCPAVPANQPAPGSPNISVMGRDADEFEIDLKTDSRAPCAFGPATDPLGYRFKVKGLPKKEPAVFLVTGDHPTVSFPIPSDSRAAALLGVVARSTWDAIKADVTSAGGVLQDSRPDETNTATIFGVAHLPAGGKAYRSVALLGEPDCRANPAAYKGPFYFTAEGRVVSAGQFADGVGTYIFFNVPPGNYVLRYQGTAPAHIPVSAVKGQVVFGYGVPSTTHVCAQSAQTARQAMK